MTANSGFSAIIRILRTPDYGLYTLGNGVSLIGLWMQRVAVGWLTWELTGSAAWLGAVAFADLFPSVLIGLVGGVAADRMDRIRVIMACQSVSMVLAALLALLIFADAIVIELVIAIVFLNGLVIGFNQPSRLALVPRLVPQGDLTTAVAFNSILFNLARFIGPAIAGVVIVASNVAWAFAANAGSYLALLLALTVIRARNPTAGRDVDVGTAARRGLLAQISDGLRYVAGHPGLGPLMLIHLTGSMMVRPIVELLPGFADRVFGGGADLLALFTSTVGIGAMAGGWMLASRRGTRGLVPLVLVSSALVAVTAIAFALSGTGGGTVWLAVPAIGFYGAAMVSAGIGTQTIVQLGVDPAMRGRVLSLHGLIFRGGPALGAIVMGTAGDVVGLSPPVILGAVGSLLVVALVARRAPAIRAAIEEAEPRTPGSDNRTADGAGPAS